ncbi:MAG: amino acid ABC transporter permease [Acidimicrobiales bacterium]|nr:amino acid ABC transporter permease [Acidimicrobiales bacterium]
MTDLSISHDLTEALAETSLAPKQAAHSPQEWAKQNLFSSVSNTIQTLLFGFILVLILQWILGLIFADERDWHAVTTNMRLLFTNNYPASQYGRIWFTFGALLSTAMLTVAAFRYFPTFTVRKILINITGTGAFIALVGALAPISTTPRLVMLAVGAVIMAAAGMAVNNRPDGDEAAVSLTAVLLVVAAAVLATIWFVPFGNDRLINLEAVLEPGTILLETKLWLSLMVGVTVVAYFAGRALAGVLPESPFKQAMVGWWILGPAFLIFLVIRDPAFDYGYVFTVDIPIALVFGLGGGALLYFLARPGNEALARAVGVGILAVCALTFILGATGSVSMLQKIRLTILALGLVALLAPTFSGEPRVRRNFAYAWIGAIAISHWLITAINTPSTLELRADSFLGGFMISITLGYYVMLASFPMGVLMSLARTSKMPLFRVMSTIYIESVRGIPLIVILFFFDNLLNLFLPNGMSVSKIAGVFIGYTLFSAAYMAENIRGGLQSVRSGQFEASDALGLTTLQRTVFIILPQALRVSIPNLVGQAIATFKETSLVSIIGAFDILYIARNVVPGQTAFIGHSIAPMLFVSLVYWIFAYSMSRASRTLETKLGVGAR